jgi:hypothetical protein
VLEQQLDDRRNHVRPSSCGSAGIYWLIPQRPYRVVLTGREPTGAARRVNCVQHLLLVVPASKLDDAAGSRDVLDFAVHVAALHARREVCSRFSVKWRSSTRFLTSRDFWSSRKLSQTETAIRAETLTAASAAWSVPLEQRGAEIGTFMQQHHPSLKRRNRYLTKIDKGPSLPKVYGLLTLIPPSGSRRLLDGEVRMRSQRVETKALGALTSLPRAYTERIAPHLEKEAEPCRPVTREVVHLIHALVSRHRDSKQTVMVVPPVDGGSGSASYPRTVVCESSSTTLKGRAHHIP